MIPLMRCCNVQLASAVDKARPQSLLPRRRGGSPNGCTHKKINLSSRVELALAGPAQHSGITVTGCLMPDSQPDTRDPIRVRSIEPQL